MMEKPKKKIIKQTLPVQHEVSAGGIVFKRIGKDILIGFILDPYNKWIFAKGHIEEGEEIREAALRETREEMGVKRLRIRAALGTIAFWFQFRKQKIHKTVHYFLMEVPGDEVGIPQKSEKIQAIRWVPLLDAREVLSYKNTRKVLDRAIEWLS